MTNPDQSVLEVARDALREGRVDDLPAVLAEQPKTALMGELIVALARLAARASVSIDINLFRGEPYAKVKMYNGATVDAVFADFVACGAVPTRAPIRIAGSNGRREWRESTVTFGGIEIEIYGEFKDVPK